MWVCFADCELNLDRRELLRGGEPVAVEPQVFDVIAYLVQHRDRVVTKHELLDNVWGDRFVSESALTSRIKFARRALGDTGSDQRIIRTVHGRGYRFLADVEAVAQTPPAATDDRLVAAIRALVDGRGAAIELEGVAGAGKTDRLDHATDEALALGLVVGRAASGGPGGPPLRIVVDALDEVLQRRPGVLDALPAGVRAELERAFAHEESSRRRRVPETDHAAALVGCLMLGGAACLLIGQDDRFGYGAFVVLVGWATSLGGAARPSSVIGVASALMTVSVVQTFQLGEKFRGFVVGSAGCILAARWAGMADDAYQAAWFGASILAGTVLASWILSTPSRRGWN